MSRGETFLISRDGAVFQSDAIDARNLPILIGATRPRNVDALMDAIAAAGLTMRDVKHAEWIAGRRWTIVVRDRFSIALPQDPTEIAPALAHAMKLVETTDAATLINDVTIDARLDDRVFVRSGSAVDSPPAR